MDEMFKNNDRVIALNNENRLDRNNVEDMLALTPTQEGMLFHYLKDPQSDQYFEQVDLTLEGEINKEFFHKAWTHVIAANEMLRTVFVYEKLSNPIQVILKHWEWNMSYIDLSPRVHAGNEQELLEEIKSKDRSHKFDLKQVPFRVTLCKVQPNVHHMIISHHHILYDGWSNGILLQEFLHTYHCMVRQEEPRLPMKPPFKQFIKHIQKVQGSAWQQYWQQYLEDLGSMPRLSRNCPLPDRHQAVFMSNSYKLEASICKQLKQFANENNVTLATLFYLAWGILLHRYCDQDDVIFGTTVSGRELELAGIEDMVGLFIQTVPLRIQFDPGSIRSHLKKLHAQLMERRDYEHVSLVDIKHSIGFKEELFESIMVVENYPIDQTLRADHGDLKMVSHTVFEQTNYDISVGIAVDDAVHMHVNFNAALFANEAIERMTAHYGNILREIAEQADKPIYEIDMLAEEEKTQLIDTWNQTETVFPQEDTLHQRFEQQAALHPAAIAVVFKDESFTYAQLNEQANQLGRMLQRKGIGREHVVAMMLERSPDMIVCMLAILKTGAVYMPIAKDHPKNRVDHMLQDSGARLLLVDEEKHRIAYGEMLETLHIREQDHSGYDGGNLEAHAHSRNAAYVLYTSGSTGMPKGVVVEHRSVVNLACWFHQSYQLDRNRNILQLAEYTFDVSVEDIFSALLHGCTLFIGDRDILYDKAAFQHYLELHQIHLINAFPGILKELLSFERKIESLRVVISGGDRLEEELKESIVALGYRLYNNYGLTETTVDSLSAQCSAGEPVALGQPISNTKAYIMNRHHQLQPVGVIGELVVSGVGLARGYLNNEGMNEQKFIELTIGNRKERIYKTGDLARRRQDGRFEFVGRIDDQVKIRGHRVELSEIEKALLHIEGIREAVVLAKQEATGESSLYAFVISDIPINSKDIKKNLSTRYLPGYMMPSLIVRVEVFPLTRNGKIDKEALWKEAADQKQEAGSHTPPQNEIEHAIHAIWNQVLELPEISTTDDFYDVGGNSLKLIRVHSLLSKQYPSLVTVQDLFDYKTIQSLAELIHAKKEPVQVSERKLNKIEF